MLSPLGAVATFTPIGSLLLAWALWRKPRPATLRDKATFCGLAAASFTTAEVAAFILVGDVQRRGGFSEPSPEFWGIAGWMAFALWSVAATTSIIGKGKSRLALAAWTLLVFVTTALLAISSG